MTANHSNKSDVVDSTDKNQWVRRSTRSRNRPALFSGSPPHGGDNLRRFAEPPIMVSPDPVNVLSMTSPSTAPAGGKQSRSKSKCKSKAIPLPDTPVSSMSMRMSISEAEAAAMMKIAVATASTTTGNKRKRTESVGSGPSKGILQLQRPTPEECEFAVRELGKLHPEVMEKCREIRKRTTITTNVANDCKIDKDIVPDGIVSSSASCVEGATVKTEDDFQASSCGDQTDILDGVFSTMLSQNTTAANSTRAFGNFKKAVPDWNLVADDFDGYQQTIETAIHCGGLAQIKAANIIQICKTVYEETGSVSLEYLREKSNKDIKEDLLRHKGLGPKTVSCVLLFTLGRNEFPVDTHVYRIAKQNKWIPNSGMSRDAAYEYLNAVIPDHLKLELHCLLVQNGRECHRCAARGKPQFPPKDGSKLDCPLKHLNAIAAANNAAAKNGKAAKVKPEL